MNNNLIQSRFFEMLSANDKNSSPEQIISAFEEFQQALASGDNTQSNKQTRIRELMHARSLLTGYSQPGILSLLLKKTPYPNVYRDRQSTAGR